MAAVTLDKLCKTYDSIALAVDSVSLEINDGEFLVLVGPSGCGKTTTLRMIAGLESITSGTLHIGERIVNDVHPKDRDIAMVFQNYALYPHMTVRQNMAFALKMRKTPKAKIAEQVAWAAGLLGLEPLLDRKPKALSGGQRQRVALGRAIVRQPAVFLFDEPLSNLDAKLRVEMRAELKRLHRQLNTTTIYVTHDQEEAMTLGDRVVVMEGGIVQQCAAPLEIYNQPANRFVASFLGMPPMNFFEGTIQRNGTGVDFVSPAGTLNLGERAGHLLNGSGLRNVVAGVRPEAFGLQANGGVAGLPATVSVVEPLGSMMDVYLELPSGQTIATRVAAKPQAEGVAVRATVAPEDVYLFDAEGPGRNLLCGNN
ncbi:ABC transporter ATP-binding protein [Adhaeretor mobilis]|uniref:sn-glycerol-3-phosphate import ATP-binding protein UgpC n=1 Tax=Adhaeretor mobilis TaxID=1930276 RepID=A0A517MZH7_9BACT|nr:sn-glycerol-3-phosphate ABC transporter ATP-binding protein UgpC [Adhaeretor mobilis]QDT00283.1 sn-glycerol-3-phosphate import ATP-binding protein UgpC [Adhaeretor mobilis]